MYLTKDRKKNGEVLLEWNESVSLNFIGTMIDFCESRGQIMSFIYSEEYMIFRLGCLWNWEYGDSGSGHFGERIDYKQGYNINIKKSEVKSIALINDTFLKVLCNNENSYLIRIRGESALSAFIWTDILRGGRLTQ